ncbi:MAG: helix-turn-helix domain-containing protein [Solobacterium sp.]|nr:helix-turn-helix domain-containing protein [Solobacterium sp.]
MDLNRIGAFLQELRKEKKLTQEQLAEKMGVARRTVSRWETGANMPDLDILVELSDFYDVELREILSGERKSQQMNDEMKQTVLQVAEYSNEEKKRSAKVVMAFFVLGIIAVAVNTAMYFLDPESSFLSGFVSGCTNGIALGAMILGILYVSGRMEKFRAFKMRMLGISKDDEQ